MSGAAVELSALGVRSPAKRRGALRPAGADRQMESRSYGFLATAEEAHPLRQRMRLEQRKVYDALLSRADNQTRLARVGLGKLADITGLKKRSVRRAIRELVALGLVEKDPRWGQPAKHDGGDGRRTRQLATEYLLPRLDAQVGAGTLLGLGDGLDVDAEDEDLHDEEAVQRAARALAQQELRQDLDEMRARLRESVEALSELAERVGRMLTGRGLGALRREAEERRVVAAVVAGRTPPASPLPDTPRTRLEAVCGATCQGDRQRFRHPAAFQEALRARSRWADAVTATLGAAVAVEEALAEIDGEAPRSGDWRKAVADARLALYLCERAAGLQATVEPRLIAAEQSWGPLPKGPPPRSLLRLASERPALAPEIARHRPWAPPALWRQKFGDSPPRWLAGRAAWERAQQAGNEKALRRLRRSGFDEGWPDPPT